MSSATEDDGGRRGFLKAGAAALTASLFTGRVRGANDKIQIGFIGMGRMGMANLGYALKIPEVRAVAVCDVYRPHLERAAAAAAKGGQEARAVADFRQVLGDASIDAVCISTPDHWHAYMTVEACKAGKDVFVEKPACVYVDEGAKMVQAARKHGRVVQAGTMQRSGGYFRKAMEIVRSGTLGDVTFCRTWQAGGAKKTGWGDPPDQPPPADLDWDMWLGPAPERPFNSNRWGVAPDRWSTFRYFWDYAGGAMTDWGVHLIDPLQCAFKEAMPRAVVADGGRLWVRDNTECPDTMLATFTYPTFLACYESRTCNPLPIFGQTYGTAFHGTEATLVVNRTGYWIHPADKAGLEWVAVEKDRELAAMNAPHWQNFIDCVRTRATPASDIETCVRSTIPCLLANLAMRFRTRVDWDAEAFTVTQPEVRPHLGFAYRSPWKLEV
jgi:predicted dehydrogenase